MVSYSSRITLSKQLFTSTLGMVYKLPGEPPSVILKVLGPLGLWVREGLWRVQIITWNFVWVPIPAPCPLPLFKLGKEHSLCTFICFKKTLSNVPSHLEANSTVCRRSAQVGSRAALS